MCSLIFTSYADIAHIDNIGREPGQNLCSHKIEILVTKRFAR